MKRAIQGTGTLVIGKRNIIMTCLSIRIKGNGEEEEVQEEAYDERRGGDEEDRWRAGGA